MNAAIQYSNRLLFKCLIFSIGLHVAFLTFFYFNPFILKGSLKSLFGLTSATPTFLDDDTDQDNVQKNREIEEVFKKIIVMSPHFQQPYDFAEIPQGISLAPNAENAFAAAPSQIHEELQAGDFRSPVELVASNIEGDDFIDAPFFTPVEAESPIASQLQIDIPSDVPEIASLHLSMMGQGEYEDLIALNDFTLNADYEADYALNLSPQLAASNQAAVDLEIKADTQPMSGCITAKDFKLENESTRAKLFIPKSSPLSVEKKEIAFSHRKSEFEDYAFPAQSQATQWNDDFDVDVVFLPNPEGKGYIFSLSIKPNYDISSQSLKQNLYFVLDRSSSVQKHRFTVFKRAVLKALASMQKGDTFNILVIDKKVARFSEANQKISMKSIRDAEEFLDKQESGGLFNSGDIYVSLDKILTAVPDNDEMHTAILLTDGKSSLNAERRQSVMKKWVEKNHGKLSLYAAAVGRDNDLVSLDMLSSLSGGKLLYSDTHASMPRKLAKLILDLKDPVAKDMIITAVPENPHAHITLSTPNAQLPTLYGHQPYVVFGQIDDPCTFDLVIQGRHHDQWIAIKKNVSFIEGKKGDKALASEWMAQHSHLVYAKFLKEGKKANLAEAKEILQKFRTEVAY